MIQDIFPSRLVNRFEACKMVPSDALVITDGDGKLLVNTDGGEVHFPEGAAAAELIDSAVYLFSLDERRYFLAAEDVCGNGSVPADGCGENDSASVAAGLQKDGYAFRTLRELRDLCIGKEVYAAFTAFHLWRWYRDNRFCGRCGGALAHSATERALVCPACGNTIYPRINPAVIVGVTKGDSILLTKYRRGFGHNALVAGFTEIGETLEETVAREVMEETGVRVRNIRYYMSQPWGLAQDVLVGFYCDADGDGEIHMDENELKYTEWVRREDIILQPNNLSLTNEMMRMFKEGKQ